MAILTKDLRVFYDREIEKMIMVDTLIDSYILNSENTVPIIPFRDQEEDNELRYLADLLVEVNQLSDLRRVVKEFYSIDRLYSKE
jgi:CTD small phosphatase-like protein 2